MPDVQLPLVLLVQDRGRSVDEYYWLLYDEFEVRQVERLEQVASCLEREVEVILLPFEAVDADPWSLEEELGLEGSRLPTAGVLASDADAGEIPENVEYVREPVTKGELRDLVLTLRKRARYDATIQRYYQLATERAKHESENVGSSGGGLLTDQTELEADLAALEETLSETLDDFDGDDIRALFEDF